MFNELVPFVEHLWKQWHLKQSFVFQCNVSEIELKPGQPAVPPNAAQCDDRAAQLPSQQPSFWIAEGAARSATIDEDLDLR